jgi:hypothetical protein
MPSQARLGIEEQVWVGNWPLLIRGQPHQILIATLADEATIQQCHYPPSSGNVGLFRVQSMVQFFWQDDLVNVSKFFCECLAVMLGADSDDTESDI